MPEGAITSHVERHFFHPTPTEPTPDAWVQSAEEWDHRFELFWVRLTGGEGAVVEEDMNPAQAAWLAEYADRLLL